MPDPTPTAGTPDPDVKDGRPDWPDGVASLISARVSFERELPGWPKPGDPPVGPPRPAPPGRGGVQRIPRPYNARVGEPPPWADLPADRLRPTVAEVQAALATVGPALPSARESLPLAGRPSAVLAPLYDDEDGLARVILTRRTWGLRTHQGEVSFPGGRVDPGEDPQDAARREAKEEIDLDPSMVELIGELDHITTVSSQSFIVPYVGAIAGGRPQTQPNPDEVDAVLHVTLAELLDPTYYREEIWTFPGGNERAFYFFELKGDTVWGMTAALLRQLLGFVTGTRARGQLGHP
jgi:8-oxo-dGTP pyrophosphatase MutT (NUDIX family)